MEKEATLAGVMDALRQVYAKLLELERRFDQQPQLALGAGRRARAPDPKHALLKGKMMAVWLRVKGSAYSFDKKDAAALKNLLKRGKTLDELVAQWERAVADNVGSIHVFDLNFSRYAPSTRTDRQVVRAGEDAYQETK